MADRRDKEKDSTVPGILGGVLGMGTAIGGMIPSLLAGPQKRQLEKMQRGGGAGAVLARQTGAEAGRRVVGAAGQRGGSGALREGLRAADRLVAEGAQQAGIVGAREANLATQTLRNNEMMRRRAFARLGAGVGQGLAGIGATLAAARDQGEPIDALSQQEEQFVRDPMELPSLVDTATGLSQPTTQQTIEEGRAGLERIGMAPGTLRQTGVPTGQFAQPGSIGEAMSQARTQGALGAQVPDSLEEVNAARMANLQAVGEQAANDFMNSVGTATDQHKSRTLGLGEQSVTPPSMSTPEQVSDYLYNAASQYNPAYNQGMAPAEAAKLLVKYNLVPIDWARLGIAPLSVEGQVQ